MHHNYNLRKYVFNIRCSTLRELQIVKCAVSVKQRLFFCGDILKARTAAARQPTITIESQKRRIDLLRRLPIHLVPTVPVATAREIIEWHMNYMPIQPSIRTPPRPLTGGTVCAVLLFGLCTEYDRFH